nr:synaptotagmin-like protein 5 isoform X2 [Megalopta genalis]
MPGHFTMRWLPSCCLSCYPLHRTREFQNVAFSREKIADPEEKEQIELHRTRSDDSLTKNEVLTKSDTSFDIADQLKFADSRKLKENILSSIDYDPKERRTSSRLVPVDSVNSKARRGSNGDWRQASEGNQKSPSLEEIFPKCKMKKMKQHSWPSPLTDVFPKRSIRKSRGAGSMNYCGNRTNDGSSLSEACSTPIIGAGSRTGSNPVMDVDDMDQGLHSGHLATRGSLSSLGARSDSMASVYSGAGEGRCCRSVAVTGEVEFALQYDYKHLTFEVHVTKCKNLAPVDVKRKRSDPYVKVYLLPDKSKSGKRKTKVKKHTLNPEFNETLKFHMSLSGLETRTLWLTVWHSDMFGRNDFLGEVRMPLENKIFDDPTPKWYPLQERTEPFDDPIAYKGEVIVGLKFVPPDPTQQDREREIGSDRTASKWKKNWSRGALHVLVKEARNLQTRGKNSGTCDPFCKSYLLPDKGRSGKQKTGVVRRSGGSPVWGHTFIYKDVSLQELAERGLELTVWDHDRIASNEFLGGVRFNLGTGKHYGKPVDWMDATGRELSLWQSMIERPNFWVEGAVTLRPNLHNHGKNNGT